jgi:acetyl-CoA/propionyl-CoA carboxylase biotin carboxyl carrier protein
MDTTLIDRRVAAASGAAASEEAAPEEVAPVAELAAVALLAHREREQRPPAGVGAVWGEPSGWRLGARRAVRYDVGGAEVRVSGPLVWIDGSEHTASLRLLPVTGGLPEVAVLTLDGVASRFDVARDGSTIWLGREGRTRALRLRDRSERLAERLAAHERGDAAAHPELRSPMPGTVIAVAVEPGATVSAGDTLVVVEAMKMEHRLLAPVDGVVRLHVAPGDLVRLDQLVAEVDADDASAPAPTTTTTDVPPAPPAPADEAVLTPSAGPERSH